MKKWFLIVTLLLLCNTVWASDDLSPLAQSCYDKSINLYQAGEVYEAKKYLYKVIVLDPNYANAYYNLAAIYENEGNLEKAVYYYKKVLVQNPNDYGARYRLGVCLVSQKDLNTAQNYLKTIPQNAPEYDSARILLNKIYPDKYSLPTQKTIRPAVASNKATKTVTAAQKIKNCESQINKQKNLLKQKDALLKQQQATLEKNATKINDMYITEQQNNAKIAEQKDVIKRREVQIKELKEIILDKDASIENYKAQLESPVVADVSSFEKTIQDQKQRIAELETSLTNQSAELVKKDNILKEKDNEIVILNKKNVDTDLALQQKTAEIATIKADADKALKSNVDSLNATIQAQKTQIDELNKALQTQPKNVANETEVTELNKQMQAQAEVIKELTAKIQKQEKEQQKQLTNKDSKIKVLAFFNNKNSDTKVVEANAVQDNKLEVELKNKDAEIKKLNDKIVELTAIANKKEEKKSNDVVEQNKEPAKVAVVAKTNEDEVKQLNNIIQELEVLVKKQDETIKQLTPKEIVKETNFGVVQKLPAPTGITQDAQGNMYIASFAENAIYKIDKNNKKTVYAKGDLISGPIGIVLDVNNNMYIANYNKDNIIKVDKTGKITVFLENIKKPYYLYLHNNALYVSEQESNSVTKQEIAQ